MKKKIFSSPLFWGVIVFIVLVVISRILELFMDPETVGWWVGGGALAIVAAYVSFAIYHNSRLK